MAIIYIDGFDEYASADITAQGWSILQAPATVEGGRVSGRALYLNSGASVCSAQRGIDSTTEYVISVAMKFSTLPSSAQNAVGLYAGSTLLGNMGPTSGNELVIRNNTTVLATTSGLGLATGVWYHIEWYYKIGTSDGGYGLRVNGVTVIDTVTNANTGSTNPDAVRLSGAANTSYYHDDLVISTGNTFLGDTRVITQVPDAAGANTAWTAEGVPTYQATGALVQATGAAAQPLWPTHVTGDIGLLIIETAGGEPPSLTTVAGFQEITNSPQATGSGTAGTRLTVYWCRATSNAMSGPILNDPGDHVSAFIMTFRGCSSGTPWNVTGGGVKAAASTSFSDDGVTTSINNCLIVVIGSDDDDNATANFDSWTNANLTSLTERYDMGQIQGNGGGIAVATGLLATAGSTGATTATHVTSTTNAYLTIALQPSVGDYDAVDDIVPDNDAGYISSSTPGDRETFGFPDLGVAGTVHAVGIAHVSRKDDAGTRLTTTVIRGGSTNYDNATTQALGADYVGYLQIYEEDPATTDPWTISNLDAREYGIKLDT